METDELKNKINEVKTERKEIKDYINNNKNEIDVEVELNQHEAEELKILMNKNKNLYNNLISIYNVLSVDFTTNLTRKQLDDIYKEKRNNVFVEFDYIISRKDYYTPEEAIDILNINRKEYEYELEKNPVRILSLIFNAIDEKSKYILGRIRDKQQPTELDLETLKTEYVSSSEVFYDKVINVYFSKLTELTKIYHIEAIDNMIKIKPALDELVSGLLSLTIILSAGMDLSISVLRGYDEIIVKLNTEKDELNDKIKDLNKKVSVLDNEIETRNNNVNRLNNEANRLKNEIDKLRSQYNELSINIKQMKEQTENNKEQKQNEKLISLADVSDIMQEDKINDEVIE